MTTEAAGASPVERPVSRLLDVLEKHATFKRWAVHEVQEHEAIVPGQVEPDIAALQKRLAEDPGFAAEVTGDKPPTPGCHTPEGCRENGCLGWCDEYKPEAAKP